MSHFVSLQYFSEQEIKELIALAAKVKEEPQKFNEALKGKCIGLLFQKPSLRTKTAFYVGALQLGADAIYYTPQAVKLGEREKVADAARTLSSYLDAIVLRTFSHEVVAEFAKFSSIPVINGLSNFLHPSQALADILTISEKKGDIKNIKIAYIGDGNNVCHSLLYSIAVLGGAISVATPKGCEPSAEVMAQVTSIAERTKAKVSLGVCAAEVACTADVLYTDVWTSMGSEEDREGRKKAFKKFQINDTIVSQAKEDCIVMHCLPAHRGEEITDSVIDGEHSVVFAQAENRLHTAKAILLYTFKQ